MTTQFHIALLRPPGYAHTSAFSEVAETFVLALTELGYPTTFAENQVSPSATNIVFGWHALHTFSAIELPRRTILFNLEQWIADSQWFASPATRALMARHAIWDYSQRNIDAIRAAGIAPRFYRMPIGTMPQLSRIAPAEDMDLDVLFYGAVNERRRKALQQVRATGLKVAAAYLYGKERDAVIARSKLVLNIQQNTADLFEIVRVSYLLANRKAVVSECYPTTEIDDELRPAICAVPFEGIAEACRRLVANVDERRALEARGYSIMTGRRQSDILRARLPEMPRDLFE
jgi:hypothetical protein